MPKLTLSIAKDLGVAERAVITIYGAGGKSTLLLCLAKQLHQDSNKVIITTTTKIYRNQGVPVIIGNELPEIMEKISQELDRHGIVVLGSTLLPGSKLAGVETSLIESIFDAEIASHILVEGDGAAGRAIKGYALHEPVLPAASHLVIPVLGLDALELELNWKNVHRPELFVAMSGAKIGDLLTAEHLFCCMKQMINFGREYAPQARIVPVFNKIDMLADIGVTKTMASELVGYHGVNSLLFTAAREDVPTKLIYDLGSFPALPQVSCVVLAAGSSERMGRDKLALELNGKTVLEHTVENACKSGATEVIVVSRPEDVWVSDLFSSGKVKVVSNHCYRQGIASSIKVGIAASGSLTQGIIFALGDQPLIPAAAYRTLIERYHANLNLVTWPVYCGKRGNPVLFDRRTWPLLMKLEGDRGGSQIFPYLPQEEVCAVELSSPQVLFDLDTPHDYQMAKEMFNPSLSTYFSKKEAKKPYV